MLHLFYDTETSGLPDWHTPSDDPGQPQIVELAAVLTDEDLTPIQTLNLIVRPDGWTIPDEIVELTGITNDLAERVGVSEVLAVNALFELWDGGRDRRRVAHNDPFDARIVRIALKRNGADAALMDAWKEAERFCTMNKSKNIVGLPATDAMVAGNRKGPKAPTLAEAYRHFVGESPAQEHRAMADVLSTIEVYRHLRPILAEQAA